MSRTVRRKNERYYNTLEDYLGETHYWWLKYRGITPDNAESVFYADKAKYYTDSHVGNHYNGLVKWEANSKRRSTERRLISKIKKEDEYYNPEFNTKYGNRWNWD